MWATGDVTWVEWWRCTFSGSCQAYLSGITPSVHLKDIYTSPHSMQSVHMTRGQSSHSISSPLCEFCRQINLCIWRLNKKKCKHVTLRRTITDLRLAVIYTVWSRAFEIQFIVENKTSFAQTWAIRVLERSIFTDTGTRWRAWEDRCDLRGVSNRRIYTLLLRWILFIE